MLKLEKIGQNWWGKIGRKSEKNRKRKWYDFFRDEKWFDKKSN